MGKALEWLGGSVLVYAAVAACGGFQQSGDLREAHDSGVMGAGGVTGTGGTTARDSGPGDVVADVLDAMVDPVPDADAAQSPGPTVTTVPCSSRLEQSGVNRNFAELAVAGRTVESLAGTIAILKSDLLLDGYTAGVAGLYFREGGIAALCGSEEQSVTFVVPPT